MPRPTALLLSLLIAAPAFAQSAIVLDGSLNGRTDDITAAPGPDYVIGDDLGVQVGGNLFHSFSLFNLATGDSATFTDDPSAGAPIGNVIARVTGGAPSQIDGTLRSAIPDADVFFLNPAGVIFGGGAAIDVPASFTVSTAHSLIYQGGAESLSTTVAANPVLRAADPAAFGFLGGAPAADVEFFNTDPINAKLIGVPNGETFTAIGGDVRATGVGERLALIAFGGRVQVGAVGSAAIEVPRDLAQWDVAPGDTTPLGEVALNNAVLDATQFDATQSQGQVVIRGGRLALANGSVVRAGGLVPEDDSPVDPAVDVAVAHDVALLFSQLRSEGQGGFEAGALKVSADEISLVDGSVLQSTLFDFGGSAPGGAIVLNANDISLESSKIESQALSFAEQPGGVAGDIVITAGTVDLDSSSIEARGSATARTGNIAIDTGDLKVVGATSAIAASSSVTAPIAPEDPTGGAIDIDATGTVRVADGAVIGADALAANPGGGVTIDAGTIEVIGGEIRTVTSAEGAGGALDLEADEIRIARDGGEFAGTAGSLVVAGATGAGGDVHIEVSRDLTLVDGGQLSTTTRGDGAAGAISIDAGGLVAVVGDQPVNGVVTPSSISARSETDANGGAIAITARAIEVRDGAQISSRSALAGSSGDIALTARDRVLVQGSGSVGPEGNAARSLVSAEAIDGLGGDVRISAPRVAVRDGGAVTVSSIGAGTGGRISVNAGNVVIAGPQSALTAEARGVGDADGIDIDATGTVRIANKGAISADGILGDPGDVTITAGTIELRGGSVTTRARGSGGNIVLRARRLMHFVDAKVITESAGISPNGQPIAGGNLTLDPPAVVLNHSLLSANGSLIANGGNIFIAANPLLASADSAITATSELGVAGTISVTSPNTDVTGDLAALPSDFLDASSLLEEACLARDEVSGTFTIRSAGALSAPPDAPLAPGTGAQCETP